jgi:hypothetical protein
MPTVCKTPKFIRMSAGPVLGALRGWHANHLNVRSST